GELGVGQPVAEWKQRLVGDIDVTREKANVLTGRIETKKGTPRRELIVIERLLTGGAWKAHGQLAAGSGISIKHTGYGGAALGARKPCLDDGIDVVGGPIEHQRTSGKDKENDRTPCGCHRFEQLLLISGQTGEDAGTAFAAHFRSLAQSHHHKVRLPGGVHGGGKAVFGG